jgi:hypothetical protein
LICPQFQLLLEEIEEGLTVSIHHLGSGAASLLFHKDFGLEKRTKVIRTFVRYSRFHGLGAFVPG